MDMPCRPALRLTQTNSSDFSPAAGVKIKRMAVRVEFDPGTTLVRSVSLELEGRAFGLLKVSQSESYAFEHVTSRWVDPPAE